jgi:glycosyltransferase involved in cell wall biosynthesis
LINVIIPIHNEEIYLESLFRGIRAQVNTTFRLLISENNSSDSTLELIQIHLGNFEHEIRIEPAPLKSVYDHYSNAIEYFLDKYKSEDKWIILSADDSWVENNFLHLCQLSFDVEHPSGPICILPSIEIFSQTTAVSSFRRNQLLVNSTKLAKYVYFLIPRVKQPILFFYGMFNTDGMREIGRFSRRVETFRMKNYPDRERVPAAEHFFCYDLIGRLQFRGVKATLKYTTHNRERNSKRQDFSELRAFQKVLRYLQNRFFAFYYLKEIWVDLNPKSKVIFTLLSVVSTVSDVYEELRTRAMRYAGFKQ